MGCVIARGATYEVGPGKPLASIGEVPWASLEPGDHVLLGWRETPYREKWVICRQGTAENPIVVRGIPNPETGALPVIDGNGATTATGLNYWSEGRGVIKIGGANIPVDTMPRHIVLDSLEIRSGRQPFRFTDDSGVDTAYPRNAAALFVEKGEHITVRNCIMHDSGNGLFIASSDAAVSRNITIEANYIHGNGNPASAFEHNSYSAGIGVVFQFNRYGPMRAGAQGNALKDRSAGLVVRYNWIEGGNRQLDLVDGEDAVAIRNDPAYRMTRVYGNVFIENAGDGNRQMVHYGGDSGETGSYRKGSLHFYHNTLVSLRTDRTTLFRLSTNEERADVRNNVFYASAAGNTLSLLDASGQLELSRNWIKPEWRISFGDFEGQVIGEGALLEGAAPGFAGEGERNFRLASGSVCINAGANLDPAATDGHAVRMQYVIHQAGEDRPVDGVYDIGAYEWTPETSP